MDEMMHERPDAAGEAEIGEPLYGGRFHCGGSAPLPFVLPGERVALPVAPGGLPAVLAGSPGRVEPGCIHFGVCGGCHYQHAAFELQVEMKREILRGLLDGEGLPEIAVHVGEPWGYRNRIRLRVEPVEGEIQLGYSRPGSNDFLPIRMCPIAAPLLWRAAEALLALAGRPECNLWLSATAEVEFFCVGDESQLQMTLWLRAAGPALTAGSFALFCNHVKGLVPQLTGAGAWLHPELNRRVRRAWTGAAWGAEGLAYPVENERYWVGRGAFFQINRFLVDRLVELVCGAQSGGLAWDLYAGVGLFSVVLARQFAQVVAVEGGAHAAASLVAASRGARGTATFTAVQAATLDFLRARVLERERPELIVLDPPRAGVGVEGAELLARIGAPRVVYVSCDPGTLARDLSVLTRSVYRVQTVDLVDLFPQTYHVETVVHLARR